MDTFEWHVGLKWQRFPFCWQEFCPSVVCFLSFTASTRSVWNQFHQVPQHISPNMTTSWKGTSVCGSSFELCSGKLTGKQGPHQDVFLIEKNMVFLVSHVCHPTVTYHRFRAQKTSASFLAMSSPVGLVSCMTMANSIPSLKLAPSCTFTVHSSYGSVTYYRTPKSFRGPWTKIETIFK